MSIYSKMNEIKVELYNSNLTKSGKNKFANFDYFELADILPTLNKLCKEKGLYMHTTFNEELATLTIIDCDKSEDKLVFTSPMRNLELKGCNEIQALGGIETYSRRYLLLMAFDIIENDTMDASVGTDKIKQSAFVKQNGSMSADELLYFNDILEGIKEAKTQDELQEWKDKANALRDKMSNQQKQMIKEAIGECCCK